MLIFTLYIYQNTHTEKKTISFVQYEISVDTESSDDANGNNNHQSLLIWI